MTQVCSISTKEAYLSGEFGEKLARKYFPDHIDSMPKLTRGKRVGKIGGKIVWRKCDVGGWHYEEQRVYRPGMLSAQLIDSKDKVIAEWHKSGSAPTERAAKVSATEEFNTMVEKFQNTQNDDVVRVEAFEVFSDRYSGILTSSELTSFAKSCVDAAERIGANYKNFERESVRMAFRILVLSGKSNDELQKFAEIIVELYTKTA